MTQRRAGQGRFVAVDESNRNYRGEPYTGGLAFISPQVICRRPERRISLEKSSALSSAVAGPASYRLLTCN